MAQYQTGTVAVTNGSAIVTGSGTNWDASMVGGIFKPAGVSADYEVLSVDSSTQITLATAYTGATDSGLEYQITTDFTPNYGWRLIVGGMKEWFYHLSKTLLAIDAKLKTVEDSVGAGGGDVDSSDFTQDGGILVGTGNGTYQEEAGATARVSLGLGTAAIRPAADAMTPGANDSYLPDVAAIKDYGDAHWGVNGELNIDDPVDDTWQGKTAPAVAGEDLSSSQWQTLCCKDTGSGTRWYKYNPNSTNADNHKYLPLALLVTNGTISAGDAIEITVGDGILANDSWGATQAQVGTAIYCDDSYPGFVAYTPPGESGDVIKQIGTLLNITANGRDVWEISFRYPAVVIP